MRLPPAFLLGALLVFGWGNACLATPSAKTAETPGIRAAPDPNIKALRKLLATPEAQLDLAKAKLTIDHMIDPKVDVLGTLKQLDALAATVKARFPAGASSRAKIDILLSSLYQPGPWNKGRPFRYDLADPLGKNIRNKLISTYLATRKGNCVSMPVLFAILAQKLGLNVTLATAPGHVLAKFGDDATRQWLNVEATAGGFKYDSSYEQETGISQAAIKNEIYLRPLGQREAVGVLMSTLMEHYSNHKQSDDLLAVANMALAANPKDVVAMIFKANAYYLQLQDQYTKRYPTPAHIPAAKRESYTKLSHDNLAWFAKAEALGWTEPTQAQEAIYLKSIQREKTARREHK